MKLALVLVLLIAIVLIQFSAAANAVLTCRTTNTACGSTELTLMRYESGTSAHAQLPSAATYTNRVCCSDPALTDLGLLCSGTYDVAARLDAATNAHVQTKTYTTFSNRVCLSTSVGVQCSVRTVCDANETCVYSISDTSNGHVGQCSYYSNNICCKSNVIPQPPTITAISILPYFTKYAALETVSSAASDPNGDQISLLCSLAPGGPYDLCAGSLATTNPSCTFTAPWCRIGAGCPLETTDGIKTIYCKAFDGTLYSLDEVSDTVFADNSIPTITTAVTPADVGINTLVIMDMTGADTNPGSGLDRIYAFRGVYLKTCEFDGEFSGNCQYTEQMNAGNQGNYIYYAGYSRDRATNQYSDTKFVHVCDLKTAAITPQCTGPSGSCQVGDTITINATYEGYCPSTSIIQVDAQSADALCTIENTGGDLSGMSVTCTAAACSDITCQRSCISTWTIPSIPTDCTGKTVSASAAAVWRTAVGTGELFAIKAPTGSFRFFGTDTTPPSVIFINPTPPHNNVQGTGLATIRINAVDTQNNIASCALSVDGAPDINMPIVAGSGQNVDCELAYTFTPGTHTYQGKATDDAGNTGVTEVRNIIIDAGVDSVSIAHAPAEIGPATPVTFTLTATDLQGIASSKIFVNTLNVQTCPSGSCIYTNTFATPGMGVSYYGEANDTNNNTGRDPPTGTKSFVVCQLDSVIISPDCGADDLCVPGERIQVNANYHGACPATNFIQVDAFDEDRCEIMHETLEGIDIQCSGSPCTGFWTITSLPAYCAGKTVTAATSSIWRTAISPDDGAEWFGNVPATGSFTFANLDLAGPLITVQFVPPVPVMEGTPLDLIATATDDSSLVNQINITIYGDTEFQCTISPAASPALCSTGLRTYTAGTHNYEINATDGVGNTANLKGTFDITAAGDVTPPSIILGHLPSEIGRDTGVNITATASDASGIASVSLEVKGTVACTQTSSNQCSNVTKDPAGTVVTYNASATDNAGNTGQSTVNSYTVCKLDSAVISDICGADNLCDRGEQINVFANYHGACPATAYMQVDAADIDSMCRIEAIGATIAPGIQGSCLSAPCNTQWNIPDVPLACQGRTIYAAASSLRQIAFPQNPGSVLFDTTTPLGSFIFWLDPGVTFTAALTLNPATPNIGTTVTGNVTCYVELPSTGERVDCDNTNSKIEEIFIDGVKEPITPTWSGTDWRFEIDTTVYNKLVGANTVNVNISYMPDHIGSPSKNLSGSYDVNFPPAITNVLHTPPVPLVGGGVTFNADIYDADGPSDHPTTAKVCHDQNCTVEYTSLYSIAIDTYSWDYSPITAGDTTYYIYAEDVLGAKATAGPFALLPTDQEVRINITYTDVPLLVPLTTTGIPDFTRGMDINFLITANIFNLTTQRIIELCNGDVSGNCDASYKIDDAGLFQPLAWDGFVNAWRGSPSSSPLSCDSTHTLHIMVQRKDGIFGLLNSPFYVNCEPRIVVNPIERRIALGQTNFDAFEVTVYNPTLTREFTIEMKPVDATGFPIPWVLFSCNGLPLAECTTTTRDTVTLYDVPALGNRMVVAQMDSPGRAGVWPIDFEMTIGPAGDSWNGQIKKARGTLQIFAESLPEFDTALIIVAMLSAALIYAMKKKGIVKKII